VWTVTFQYDFVCVMYGERRFQCYIKPLLYNINVKHGIATMIYLHALYVNSKYFLVISIS